MKLHEDDVNATHRLLKMAAKSIGIELIIKSIPHRTAMYGTETVYLLNNNPCLHWNPIIDDGDALRLAVKLDFRIDVDKGRSWAAVMTPRHLGIDSILETNENGDPYAATRRAIVRAAAAIGESMP